MSPFCDKSKLTVDFSSISIPHWNDGLLAMQENPCLASPNPPQSGNPSESSSLVMEWESHSHDYPIYCSSLDTDVWSFYDEGYVGVHIAPM